VEEGRRAGRRQTREAGKKLRAKDGPQQWPLLLRLMSRGGCGLTFRGRMRDRLGTEPNLLRAGRITNRHSMDFGRIIGTAARLLILPFYRRKLRKFESLLARARSVQTRALFSKIERCRDTGFGRDHNFSGIRTLEDFRREVPLSTYADVAPYIDKVCNGHKSALFPESEKVEAFACTAGTTGRPKIIPITHSWLQEYRRSWEVWGVKAVIDRPNLAGKRWLQISGPETVDVTPSGMPIGMISAVTARFQSPLVRSFYVGPIDIANIVDPLAHYYTILRLSIGTNVGFITTITPANLIRLAEVGDQCREALIRDLHEGTLRHDLNIPEDIRRKINGAIKIKRPGRARELESVVSRTDALYPKDYWPLVLLACWLGGRISIAPAQEVLRRCSAARPWVRLDGRTAHDRAVG